MANYSKAKTGLAYYNAIDEDDPKKRLKLREAIIQGLIVCGNDELHHVGRLLRDYPCGSMTIHLGTFNEAIFIEPEGVHEKMDAEKEIT